MIAVMVIGCPMSAYSASRLFPEKYLASLTGTPAKSSLQSKSETKDSAKQTAPPVPANAASSTKAVSPKNALHDGLIKYPIDGSIIDNRKPTIGADYRNIPEAKESASVKISVDGNDFSANCDMNKGYFFCKSPDELAAGEHRISCTISDKNGKMLVNTIWKFFIAGSVETRMLYPPSGAEVDSFKPVIGLNFKELPRKINPGTARIFVDGKEITSQCDVAEDYIFCTPAESLAAGGHAVTFKVKTAAGTEMEPLKWSFSVAKALSAAVAEAQSAKKEKTDKQKSAAVIASAQRYDATIAAAADQAGAVISPPVEQAVYAPTTVQQPQAVIVSKPYVDDSPLKYNPPKGGSGLEYSLETMYGYENMDITGDDTRSSQNARNAYIYKLGLRTQMNRGEAHTGFFKSPTLSTVFRMEGTTDGDETETFWDVKKFTGVLDDTVKKFTFYEIGPKYTPYSLSGQLMYGAEFSRTWGTKATFDIFDGKLKRTRSGKRIKMFGTRYTRNISEASTLGLHYLNTSLQALKGPDHDMNSLFGFDISNKFKLGDAKFEWARSRYSDIGSDNAYRLEGKYRKRKIYMTGKYERVGEDFRSESGFASQGLKEANSTLQYQFNQRLTAMTAYKKRYFSGSGNKTVTIPTVFMYVPFKNRPSTTLELRNKLTWYDKGDTFKDTVFNSLDIKTEIGKASVGLTCSQENNKRNIPEEEEERVTNFSYKLPVTKKAGFSYKLNKLNNNFYGPESKNTFGVSYELSDWSDLNLSLEKINKVQATLDRTTEKLRFGMVNPDKNTEMSLDYWRNHYLLFGESFFQYKYSKFY